MSLSESVRRIRVEPEPGSLSLDTHLLRVCNIVAAFDFDVLSICASVRYRLAFGASDLFSVLAETEFLQHCFLKRPTKSRVLDKLCCSFQVFATANLSGNRHRSHSVVSSRCVKGSLHETRSRRESRNALRVLK
mgnify:CR=1 FL=1